MDYKEHVYWRKKSRFTENLTGLKKGLPPPLPPSSLTVTENTQIIYTKKKFWKSQLKLESHICTLLDFQGFIQYYAYIRYLVYDLDIKICL